VLATLLKWGEIFEQSAYRGGYSTKKVEDHWFKAFANGTMWNAMQRSG